MDGITVTDGHVQDDASWLTRITTAPWLTGPPNILQGGTAAGLLLAAATDADRFAAPVSRIDARLHRPTPPGVELTATCERLAAGRHQVEVSADAGVTVSGEVELRGHDVPARVPDLVSLAGRDMPPPQPQSDYPHCWVCGPGNPNGLHLHPRYVRPDVVLQHWWPPDTVESSTQPGVIDPIAIAAILDCPTVWASMGHVEEPMKILLLGGFRIQFFADAPMGDDYRIVATPDVVNGRKIEARAALLDDRARPVAVAWALQVAAPGFPELAP